MIWKAPAESGREQTAEELLKSLGAGDWSVRQDAVQGLAAQTAQDSIEKLLVVVREQHRDLARLNAALQVLVRTPLDVVPELIRLLAHPDHDVRAYAALALGDRGDPAAIAPLMGLLPDPDANVRMHAVEALGKLRAGAAVDALIGFAESMDFELAFPAIDALIAIGDSRITHRLAPLLQHSVFKVVTVQALGVLGDEEVVQTLLNLLVDPDVPPAEVAAALVRIHERYTLRYGDTHTIPAAVCALANRANVRALVAAAAQLSASVRSGGPTLLSWLPGPEADEALARSLDRPALGDEVVAALANKGPSIVPLLLQRLPAASGDAQKVILEVLSQVGDRSVVPALLKAIQIAEDEDLLVRLLETLGRLGDTGAYGPLRDFLGHPSSRIRNAAVAAVNSLACPKTPTDLLVALQDPSPYVRESYLRIAAYVGPPQCLEALLTCCGDADERVRRAAVEGLPTFDDPRVMQRLGQAIRTDTAPVRAAAASALAKTDDKPAAARLLSRALHDGDVWVRYFAIRSLLAINSYREHTAELAELAMNDPATQVRLAAIEALGESGPLALPVLLELSRAADGDLAGAALIAVGATGQAAGPARLSEAIQSQSREKQIQAARGLARSKSREAVESLRAAAVGSDAPVATEAIVALGQLGIPEAAAALIEVARLPSRRDKCINALAAMSVAAVPALAQGLLSEELDARRAVVEALARIGQPPALAALEVALVDREPGVRHAALSALAHIRRESRTTDSAPACESKP